MDTYKYLLPEINGIIDSYCRTNSEFIDELKLVISALKYTDPNHRSYQRRIFKIFHKERTKEDQEWMYRLSAHNTARMKSMKFNP